MRVALHLAPVALSLIVLGAHFLRSGDYLLLVTVIGLLALVGVRRPWSARTLQAALVSGSLVWLVTLVQLAALRLKMGRPALRLAIILGSVAAVTMLSALMFQTRTLRRVYGLEAPEAEGDVN